jgi:hypothetical protein
MTEQMALAALLRRAAAGIETPDDLTEQELGDLAWDLCAEADRLDPEQAAEMPSPITPA